MIHPSNEEREEQKGLLYGDFTKLDPTSQLDIYVSKCGPFPSDHVVRESINIIGPNLVSLLASAVYYGAVMTAEDQSELQSGQTRYVVQEWRQMTWQGDGWVIGNVLINHPQTIVVALFEEQKEREV